MMEPDTFKRFSRDLRAMAGKADDAEGFAQAVQLYDELWEELRCQAKRLQLQGYSSADLAAALGVSRQAAHRRWLASA